MADLDALREALEGLRRDRQARTPLAREAGFLPARHLLPGSGMGGVVPVDRMLYAERQGGRLHVHLDDGTVVTSNTTYTPERLLEDLPRYPALQRVHDRYVANLAQLEAIGPPPPERDDRELFLGRTRQVVPLAGAYAGAVQRALGLKSLDHAVPWNDRYQAILDENLRTFEQPIQSFSVERLHEEFRYRTRDKLEVRQLISNMIWQYHTWLSLPDTDPRKTWPVEGNIRTFWYHIKPVISRLGVLDAPKQYDQLIDVFGHLVCGKKFFRYKDFGFVDEGESNRKLPERGFPHIILVAEKAGHFRKLEKLQAEFGFTIVALGGGPSILSAEYFVDELVDRVDLKATPLRLISLVDYDPSGDIIISSFRSHLMKYGVKSHSLAHVLTPARFSPEELPNVVFDIPMNDKDDRTKAERWIARGGGIDGKPLGIECEALVLDYGRLRAIVAELVDAAKRPPVELFGAADDPLVDWGLPRYFTNELIEAEPEGFWRRWTFREDGASG